MSFSSWEDLGGVPVRENDLQPVTITQQEQDGSGYSFTTLNGDAYTGQPSLVGTHSAGDRLYIGNLGKGTRNPLILEGWANQVKELPSDWMVAPTTTTIHASGNVTWIAPEATTSLPGALYGNLPLFPLQGNRGGLFTMQRCADSSTLTEAIAVGRVDPRGMCAFADSTNEGQVSAYAPIMFSATYPSSSSACITEYADDDLAPNTWAIAYPSGQAETFTGGQTAQGSNFEPDRRAGYLWYLPGNPNGSIDWYVVCNECGIYVQQRSSPYLTQWSSWVTDTLRPSRSGSIFVSSYVTPDTGQAFVVECGYLGLVQNDPTALNPTVASAGYRGLLHQYTLDTPAPGGGGTGVATYQGDVAVASVVAGGVSTLFGVGIMSASFAVAAGQTSSNWTNNFQSGGGPYLDVDNNAFSLVAAGTGNRSFAYTSGNNSVFQFGAERQIRSTRWPELPGSGTYWLYVNAINTSGNPVVVIAAVTMATRSIQAMATILNTNTAPLFPYPSWLAEQQNAAQAACAASYAAGLSATNAHLIEFNDSGTFYTLGSYWGGDQTAANYNTATGAVTVVSSPKSISKPARCFVHPPPADWDDQSWPTGCADETVSTTSDQMCAGSFDETLTYHSLVVSVAAKMATGYQTSTLTVDMGDNFSTGFIGEDAPGTGLIASSNEDDNPFSPGYNDDVATVAKLVASAGKEFIYAPIVTGSATYSDVWQTYLVLTSKSGAVTKIDITQYAAWSGLLGDGVGRLALKQATNYPLLQAVWDVKILQNWIFILRQWTPQYPQARIPHLEIRPVSSPNTVAARFNLQPAGSTVFSLLPRTNIAPRMITSYDNGSHDFSTTNGTPVVTIASEWDPPTAPANDFSVRQYSITRFALQSDGATWLRTDSLSTTYPENFATPLEMSCCAMDNAGNFYSIKDAANASVNAIILS